MILNSGSTVSFAVNNRSTLLSSGAGNNKRYQEVPSAEAEGETETVDPEILPHSFAQNHK